MPDEHSLAARWVTLDELAALPQRGDEPYDVFEAVLAGAPVLPLGTLRAEGERWTAM